MDRIEFTVNEEKCSVGPEVDSDVSLNDYLRGYLDLRGTKYMCKEGGCGACIVSVTVTRDGHRRTISVNSCLVSVLSCQDWEVTTIEGIGDRRTGYHPVQKTLAEYNGTQCGYCSPGWVMSMHSLLESNDYKLSQFEIEDSFGSNVCRCTGYRPILDAFKTFAKDSPKPQPQDDIEDLKLCKNKDQCKEVCGNDWCHINQSDLDTTVKKIHLKDDRTWYRVKEISDIFGILDKEGTESYMLVNGNTGRGAVPIFSFPKILIDISPVADLKGHYVDQNLVVGGGTTLTELMELFKGISKEREEFAYLEKLYEHLNLVAHIPVRNIGTVAGNLMVKHRKTTFSSDIFLLLESIGATLTIVDKFRTLEVLPELFLALDMTGRIITAIKIPPFSSNHQFVSYKIMPRAQSAHAQVNAAFVYRLDAHDKETVISANIVITGLSGKFIHARHTENYLIGKKLFTNETLQEALKILDLEIIAEEIPGEMLPNYRKKCALGLFYKGLLHLIPRHKLKPWYHSGQRDFRKTRPLSKGTEVYDTNPILWPATEPMPKVEALIQCAGEAKYVNDLPKEKHEVYCAFVTSDVCTGEILDIDPAPALKLPGVFAFFSAKDLPGTNNYVSYSVPGATMGGPEEVFAEKSVKYYDQPIGIIVAETEKLANQAALLVHVKYRKDKDKPILTINEARQRDPSRVTFFYAIPPTDRGPNVQRVIKGTTDIFWQYGFTMETLSCVSRPSDDGIDVFPATQWTNLCHVAIAEALKIDQSRINLETPRCGGAYGVKISRATQIAIACALTTYLLNRPCRMVLSIQANMRCIGKRLPCTRDFEVGVNDEGEIQYLEYHLYEDNGYVFAEPVIGVAITGIKNCYDRRRWSIKTFNVTTDTASNTYLRAPGSLEAIAMTEYLMEQISYEIGRDPLRVRLNNLNPEYPDVAEMVQTLLVSSDYDQRRQEIEAFNKINRWKKKGLRVSLMSWPEGVITDHHVVLTVYHGDATVAIKHGGIEIGQGLNTKVVQAVAYTLNIPIEKVKTKPNDVFSNPNTVLTGLTRTSDIVVFGAVKCCQILLDRLSAIRETLTNPTWEVLIKAAFTAGINLQTSYQVTGNDATPYRIGGASFTEVELDILTGEHEVLRVDIIEDVGTSLNPEIDIGQIEGAFIMGLGYWTHEEEIYDEHTGELLTDRTWNYHVPQAKDIPIDFRVQLRRNSYNPLNTFGAKGSGEPAITLAISVAFALREAITASREDSGIPRNKWFEVGGPYTLAANVLSADVRLDEFLFN